MFSTMTTQLFALLLAFLATSLLHSTEVEASDVYTFTYYTTTSDCTGSYISTTNSFSNSIPSGSSCISDNSLYSVDITWDSSNQDGTVSVYNNSDCSGTAETEQDISLSNLTNQNDATCYNLTAFNSSYIVYYSDAITSSLSLLLTLTSLTISTK
eukprot:Pgem_evm2s16955